MQLFYQLESGESLCFTQGMALRFCFHSLVQLVSGFLYQHSVLGVVADNLKCFFKVLI